MAEEDKQTVVISEPGILALGAGLPPGPSIQSYFSGETIRQVACGLFHSAVVCDSGKVFIFGENEDNWLTEVGATVTAPWHVASLATVRVTQAACGYQFTLFLTDEGKVYSCGENKYGELGLGHTNKNPSPVLVTGLPRMKKVAAGERHSVALSVSGEVWVTGHNGLGQLGLGHTDNQSSFVLVPNLAESITEISCGARHTALLSSSQVLLMAGYNGDGQLGLGSFESTSTLKQVSVRSTAVVAVSCGRDHTVALRTDGTVWCFGGNACGQLGTGDKTKRPTPTQMAGLENYTITEVIAGGSHTALITDKGDVLVCGRGANGELGLGKEDLLEATLLPKSTELVVKQVAFTMRYSLMLVESNSKNTPTVQLECGATLKDDPARGSIADWEKSIMKSLECPVCFKVMCKPIHQCFNGHSLCDTCRSHTSTTVCPLCQAAFGNVRNLALESQTAEIQLPCIDCLRRMPACELELHAEVCPDRKYSCPIERSCGWGGRPDTMLTHTSSAHPDQTWRDLPHLFLHSTSDQLVFTDVLAAHGQVFTLHRRFSQATREFQAVGRFIGPLEDKDKFTLEFVFIINTERNIYRRNVCADIKSVDDAFQSSNCVLLGQKTVAKFLQNGCLVCQATIIKEETSALADQIKSLFIANK